MKEPAIPLEEEYRVEALRSLNLLDTRPEAQFDSIVRLGQKLFGVEICLVSLVDRDRQWFKARVGLDAPQTPRSISFCGHAILQDRAFVVRDASQDPRFHDNPLVTGPPHIRFYAGMPLRIPTGYKLGTLCIISPNPRPHFGPEDEALLEDLASALISTIAMRAIRDDGDALRARSEKYETLLDIAACPLASISAAGAIEASNEAFNEFCGVAAPKGKLVGEVLKIDSRWRERATEDGEFAVISPKDPGRWGRLYPYNDGFLFSG